MSEAFSMDINAVMKQLPHRYPFLLVDRVLACVPGESIEAIKNVTVNEPFFPGHFPYRPVMPGVMILEALAQAAGILAFKTVAPNCKPVLLEPLMDVEVLTPEEYLGAVMGDLNSRRGQILGSENEGRLTRLKAIVPEAEMYKYATQLHSITHGRATHRTTFRQYAEVPPDVAKKIVDEYQKTRAEEKAEA